tara:strand:+ start:730 stop:1506 length:777 start_codon:yes stop_codon:yes gene_type:complete
MALIDELAKEQYGMFEPTSTFVQPDPSKRVGMDPFGQHMESLTGMGNEALYELLNLLDSASLKELKTGKKDIEVDEAGVGSILRPLIKALKPSLKKGIKGAKKALFEGASLPKRSPVNTKLRKALNQFLNPMPISGPTGTYFGRGLVGRGLTVPNLYMGKKAWSEGGEGREDTGPVLDILNLLAESRADYFSPVISRLAPAIQPILDFGGDEKVQKKKKKEIHKKVEKHLGIDSKEDKSQKKEESTKEPKFKLDWSNF